MAKQRLSRLQEAIINSILWRQSREELKQKVKENYPKRKDFDSSYSRAIKNLIEKNWIEIKDDVVVKHDKIKNPILDLKNRKKEITCVECLKKIQIGEYALKSEQPNRLICLNCREKQLIEKMKSNKQENKNIQGQLKLIKKLRAKPQQYEREMVGVMKRENY